MVDTGRANRRKLVTEIDIPRELEMEILSWLPAEHLWPLRGVSKTWLQLITLDPQFAQLHYNRSLQSNIKSPNPSILHVDSTNHSFYLATDYTACHKAIQLEFPLPFHRNKEHYYLDGICNGLLFFRRHPDYKRVHIWNPLTKDYISIHNSPAPSTRYPLLTNSTTFGFGFDHIRNEYKVVRVFCESDSSSMAFHSQVSVYTLGVDSSWRTVEEDNTQDLDLYCKSSTHLNGILHWLTEKQCKVDRIIAFGFKDEVFQEILLPSDIINQRAITRIGVLSGFLCLFRNWGVNKYDIWMMKEHGVVNSWTKQFNIEKPYQCGKFYGLEILGLARDGGIIVKKIADLGFAQHELGLYDPETNSIGKLKQFQKPLDDEFTFVGSIVSPSVISRARKSLTKE